MSLELAKRVVEGGDPDDLDIYSDALLEAGVLDPDWTREELRNAASRHACKTFAGYELERFEYVVFLAGRHLADARFRFEVDGGLENVFVSGSNLTFLITELRIELRKYTSLLLVAPSREIEFRLMVNAIEGGEIRGRGGSMASVKEALSGSQ